MIHVKAVTRVLLASFTQLEKSSSLNVSHIGYACCNEHPYQFLNILTTPGCPNQSIPSVASQSQVRRNKSSSPSVGHAPYFVYTSEEPLRREVGWW